MTVKVCPISFSPLDVFTFSSPNPYLGLYILVSDYSWAKTIKSSVIRATQSIWVLLNRSCIERGIFLRSFAGLLSFTLAAYFVILFVLFRWTQLMDCFISSRCASLLSDITRYVSYANLALSSNLWSLMED